MFLHHLLLMTILLGTPSPPVTPEPVKNYCNDVTEWQKWQKLADKYPDDDHIAAAYALRVGLCEQIQQGVIDNDRAIKIFEQFFTALKESTREAERQQATKEMNDGSQI